MILAGMDEAGYGPLLGPLVAGCCAFELPQTDHLAPLPCLWKQLQKLVSKSKPRNSRKIHINDSKQVYSTSIGLKELERSILAIAHASDFAAEDLHAFLARVCPQVLSDLPNYPWYDGTADAFPIDNDGTSIRIFANALRLEMQRAELRCVCLCAQIVLEKQLNKMIAATRNKASVLFSTHAIHLDYLLRNFGDKGLTIICDRQGGRGHYGSLLRQMFEEWQLEVINEIDGRAEYRLSRGPNIVRLIFAEKAEELAMPVALASMLSKYLREALMRRFNRYWKNHLPELTPTAGYYNDGERFLRDIASKRRELGIRDEHLVRCR